MKKTVLSVKTLSMLLLCAVVALIPSLYSCSKEKKADISDLLATVPSSAGMVIGLNLNSMLEKAGCKVEGSTITPGKDLKELLDSPTFADYKYAPQIRTLLSGDSGIDPVGALVFADAYDAYFTAALADTEKFLNFATQLTELPFEDAADNVKVSGNVAVYGAQMWMSLKTTTIDANAVKNYTHLDAAQSFLSLDIAYGIANMSHDIVGYGQIKNFSRSGLGMADVASINFLSGFLFENASAMSFNFDFLKGEMTAKASILNDKGKPAKYLLPANKISLEEVKMLPATADVVAAAALTKDLISKITKMSQSLGGGLPAPISSSLAALDGTAAIALGNLDNPQDAISAVIATDGKPSLEFMQILSTFGNTQKDGKIVKLSKGEVNGPLNVATIADKFKGSTLAFAASANSDLLKGGNLGLSNAVFTLNPEGNSLTLNTWVSTTQPDINALLTILKKLAE